MVHAYYKGQLQLTVLLSGRRSDVYGLCTRVVYREHSQNEVEAETSGYLSIFRATMSTVSADNELLSILTVRLTNTGETRG